MGAATIKVTQDQLVKQQKTQQLVFRGSSGFYFVQEQQDELDEKGAHGSAHVGGRAHNLPQIPLEKARVDKIRVSLELHPPNTTPLDSIHSHAAATHSENIMDSTRGRGRGKNRPRQGDVDR